MESSIGTRLFFHDKEFRAYFFLPYPRSWIKELYRSSVPYPHSRLG